MTFEYLSGVEEDFTDSVYNTPGTFMEKPKWD